MWGNRIGSQISDTIDNNASRVTAAVQCMAAIALTALAVALAALLIALRG